MEPTELYNKSKRNLAIFTAVLALVLFGRVQPDEGGKLLGFKLAPEAIPTILFFVVAYLLYQFVLARVVQRDEVRNQLLVRVDFFVLVTFSSLAMLVYLTWYLPQLFGFGTKDLLALASLVVSGLAAAFVASRTADLAKTTIELFKLRKSSISQRLKQPGWILTYRALDPDGHKPISFNDDGTIGEGQNSNEHRWKLEGDHLSIFRENGDLQNKFAYIPSVDRFASVRVPAAKGSWPQSIDRK